MNSLLSYPGIHPNVYIASHVIPGIYAAAVAKCSKVMFHRIKQWMLKGSKTIMIKTSGNEKTHYTVVLACCADDTKLPPFINL